MIKISTVSYINNDVVLIISYDFKEQNYVLKIRKGDLDDRLSNVKSVLGRRITKDDYKQAIITLINEVRNGRNHTSDNVDFKKFIGVDLE